MTKNKSIIGIMLVLALLALPVGTAYAAPSAQGSTIDGTVQSVTQSSDSSGDTVFVVTVLDSSGNTQTVRLSAPNAVSLGLVTDNGDGTYAINDVVGSNISIPGSMVIADPCSATEGNMVAGLLARFFCQGGSTVLDNSVDTLHSEGFGFGEIAQSCFMAQVLQTTCGEILSAKKSHDFTMLGVPADVSNWGQLKKYALGQEVKSLTNLGAIVSGRVGAPGVGPTPTAAPLGASNPNANGGNGSDHGHGQGGGNGHGHGHKP